TLPVWPLRKIGKAAAVVAEQEPEAGPALVPLQLRWINGEMRSEVVKCNGCGHCRTEVPHQRMCPVFRATHAEAASPRAKANLLRHVLQEGAETRLSSDDVRAVADLCVNCKMCALECPAHVNIPRLMLEAKAANVAEHGLDSSGWFFAHAERLLRWGSTLYFLSNFVLRSRPARWLLDRLFRLSPRRRLPLFALK